MGSQKLKTGILGLDKILFGGVLENESILIEGLPGTGKTTLGFHFILQGISEGQAGLIVTFEEFPAQYYRDALQFGWDLKQLEKDQKLKIIMTSPKVLSQELEKPGGMVEQTIRELDAKRVLIDSINFLAQHKIENMHRREQINRFINGFKRQSITTFLIKDIEDEDLAHWGMYSVDCYIRLSFELVRDYQRRRLIEVFKARGQKHLHGQHPFEITEEGIEVYPTSLPSLPGATAAETAATFERVSTGIDGLDEMLGGGYYRGQPAMIAGTSGTGKTVLALQFIEAGLKAGEICLYLSLEELDRTLLRHAHSLGMAFEPYLEKEQLTVVNIPTAGLSEGEFLHLIHKHLEEIRPKRVVIDPITFLNNIALSKETIHLTFQSMMRLFRDLHVTLLCTSEISEVVGDFKLSDHNLSYMVDTVILVRMAEIEGSIRKALMIIKQRGSSHDRNLRELLIGTHGVSIGDPFHSHEGILAGMTRRRSGADPYQLLVVDDDQQMLELIKATFRDEPYTLVTCGDGESALKLTMTEGPDLILLDLMLPKLNGFEVCQKLKQDPATANIPIIMLSAKGETESKVHGLKIGADDYLTKPFSPQELVARVKMILRRVYSKRLH